MMPLKRLPDRFDGPTHDELDEAVNKSISGLPKNMDGLSIASHLLSCIVEHSKGDLDIQYYFPEENKILILDETELRDMLISAWKSRSYREIRNLAILKPKPLRLPIKEPEMVYVGLSRSFKAKYYGVAVEGFHEYLTENESLFRERKNPAYYGRLCSIVQSSGTGKSRLLTELHKKDIIVIYMNIRDETDVRSFPTRDPIPANILTKFPPGLPAYQRVCYAFFTALFDALDEQLHDSKGKEGVMEWARQMCDVDYIPRHTTRSNFFNNVLEKYNRILARLVRHLEFPPALLFPVYCNLGDSLERIFPGDSRIPRVVIALDEAHQLVPTGTGIGGYCPADILCEMISRYSYNCNFPIWVVFASTTSRVADFLPSNEKHGSGRFLGDGERFFPPYTQLGWDQNAKALGDVSLEEVSKLSHIVGYGRPLWRSIMTALAVPSLVLLTASWKLCGSETYNPEKIYHVLAVLNQRFVLNVTLGHPDSVAFLDTAVESHMRVCIGTTQDRCWQWTNYPSEPILSCVAANNLHKHQVVLQRALRVFLDAVNRGLIDVGQRGELASRFLWLLAKDLYVRASAPKEHAEMPKNWDEEMLDCKMIPVVDWLEFTFGSQMWSEENPQASLARQAFEGAYINFSHWVCMDANLDGSEDGGNLDWDELMLRHWQRTSAAQCYHLQPLIDKIIPIYFKNGSGTASAKSRMSQILISDKAKQSKSSRHLLNKIARRSEHVTESSDSDRHPYIAILVDLGQEPSFSSTYAVRDVDDRCLRIYAGGLDTTIYAFLVDHPELKEALQTLVRLQQIPETRRSHMEYLKAQMKFGSTTTAQHMRWENGKTVPGPQARE